MSHKTEIKIRNKWINHRACFSKNELQINHFQVMQRWEDNYMRELAKVAASEGGDILEVGFGMGLSAQYIQGAKKIKSHVIIECHPNVLQYAYKKFKNAIAKGKLTLINGFWEDVTPKLKNETFNGILFDTSPIDKGVVSFHFFPFFKEAFRLLRKGGIFTYFSDEPKEFSKKHLIKLKKAGFKKIDCRICRINPPKYCKYWRHKTIIVPIITK